MCGIAAIFAYGDGAAPVEGDELVRIREAMLPRGPDGSGVWVSGDRRVGMAHRRLSIIDLSDAGTQPMVTDDGLLQVVFNGEIYNYRELRVDLEEKGYRFRSNSDTEVLLHLYSDRGNRLVRYLRGMYAFVLWDERERRLLLGRDPFGIKPLYYADNGHTLRIASQVKALLQGVAVDTTPEAAGQVGFFLWGYVPEPYTLYRGIKALPAGSTLSVESGGRGVEDCFCDIAYELAAVGESSSSGNQPEARQTLRAALIDSVEHHLLADVPVGLFLSSGLDSTTLAALASEVAPGGLRAITLGFKEYHGTEDDETPLAEMVAKNYRTEHVTRWMSKSEFQTDLGSLLEAMDQPSIDGVNTYFVSKAAAGVGLKVALSGLGGDELFRGYPSFSQVPRLVRGLSGWGAGVLGRGLRWVSAPLVKHLTSPKYAGLLEYGGSYGGAYLLRRGLFMPWELPQVLDGSLVREGWRDLQPLVRLEEIVGGIESDGLKVSALEATWYMRNQLLRDADWAGMAHSVEIRVPLVDLELLRRLTPLLANGSPPSKLDMARTPAKPLPSSVLKRPKTGFTVPVRSWLLDVEGVNKGERGLRGWARAISGAFGGVS